MTMGGHLTTGRHMRDGDDSDRLLVRPYVQPGAEAKVSSIHTEEEPVPDDARGEQRSTAVLPKTVEPPAEVTDGRDRRVVLWLVGAGLALIVAVAVAIIGLWPHGDDAPGPWRPGRRCSRTAARRPPRPARPPRRRPRPRPAGHRRWREPRHRPARRRPVPGGACRR